MQKFKSILLYHQNLPESGRTLKRAIRFARTQGAHLTIVDVMEGLPAWGGIIGSPVRHTRLLKHIRDLRRRELARLIAPIRRRGVQVDAGLLTGVPHIAIIREVMNRHCDLVIKAARSGGIMEELLFGSAAMHLMRNCPCAVWLMKAGIRKRAPRILAAVDPDSLDGKRTALNRKIMDLAVSLAQSEKGELHVIHAWSLDMERVLRGTSAGVLKKEMDSLLRGIRKRHQAQLQELLAHYPLAGLAHKVYLLKGDAGRRIAEVARKKRIDLIVMGTVCRTGIAGLLIGNTAEKILHQVNCSVLTVKPDGFLSPIALSMASAAPEDQEETETLSS